MLPAETIGPCLQELIAIDLEYRHKASKARGIAVRELAHYLDLFPEVQLDEGLIAEEYRCRRKWGISATIEEYVREFGVRFPELATALQRIDLELKESIPDAESMAIFPNAGHETVASGDPSGESELAVRNAQSLPGKIDRYRVLRLLGTGNFGHVFLARDEQLGRLVAIKTPHDRSASLPLLSEAALACSIVHANLVTIYDVVPHATTHAIVMEYLEGGTLDERLSSQQYSSLDTVRLMIKMADALHACHREGVYHCDFKPANVLLESHGEPRITDFGLSVRVDGQSQLAGRIAGSPAYMAPEQVRGETHWLDGRTDIWGLGVLMYRMLCGVTPFPAQSVSELFDEILYREPRALRQIDDTISIELEEVCNRCLAKRIRDRYSSAFDLATDLRRIVTLDESSRQVCDSVSPPTQNRVDLSLPVMRSIVGRDAEVALLSGWLTCPGTPMVCIAGPAGIGKTMLAVEVGRRTSNHFLLTRFLPMAQVTSPMAFYEALMDSFAMPREAGISRESLRSSLFVALRSQPTGLLILDNCEHLASTDESLLNDLAAAAPHLRLVITSRVRPNNPAMRILELEPLDYEHRDETSGNLPPAVELFEKCAQDQDHRFRVTSEDYSYVQEICRQLDGIPLAVELAASRINLFAPSQILRRLADRKKFFAGMSSAGAFFPRSLSSAIRWSFDLLSTKARYVLTGLGRLPGGIFPEHAEQIISSTIDGVNALELIEELRRHSLIQTISTRFGKRLTIYRAIADELDELHQQFDSELLKAMWSNTGRVLCNATEPLLYELRTSRGPDAIDQILLERDNLLAVQRTAVNEGDMETASRAKLVLNEPLLLRGASVLLSQLWNTAPNDADGVRGIDLRIAHARWLRAINAWSEAQQEATCAFERARNVRDEVREHHACLELGLLANARGEFRVAQAYLQQIIQAKSSSVPHAVLVDALAGLGHAAERVETLGQARSRYDEALKLAQSCGDLAAQANLLRRKGNVATQLGSFDEALQFLNESIEIARVSEDLRNEHLALTSSGVVYSEMGQYEQAIDCYDRAQEIAVRIGAQRAVATNEGNRGVALAGLGDHVAAIHGYEIAEEINRKLGNYVAAATNLGNAAVSKAVLGDWQAATTTIQLAREQIQKCDDRIHLAIIEGDFGIMEYCCGRLEAAAELLKSAVNNLNAIGLGNSPLLIPYLECLVGCERERGNAQAAAELNADWQRLRALKSDAWIGRHPLMQTATQRGGAGAVEQSASGSWGKNVLSCRVLKVLR